MKDIEQILGKFVLWRVRSLIENHEFSTVVLDNLSNEFTAKSCQSVTVGNHKLDAIAAHCAFQNGFKSGSFEIESTTNVLNDFCLRILIAHELNLAVKFIALFE